VAYAMAVWSMSFVANRFLKTVTHSYLSEKTAISIIPVVMLEIADVLGRSRQLFPQNLPLPPIQMSIPFEAVFDPLDMALLPCQPVVFGGRQLPSRNSALDALALFALNRVDPAAGPVAAESRGIVAVPIVRFGGADQK
jgi:hypothetical protein